MNSKPLKVLIATYWYAPIVNGVVTSVLNLERELRMMGHEVRVLTLSDTHHSYKDGDVYRIRSIKAGAFYPDARVPLSHKTFMRELTEWKPDIIHSQCELFVFPYAKKVAASTGAPLIHTYHTVYEDYTHYFLPNRVVGKRAAAFFSRHKLNQVNAVVAPTNKVRNILVGYGVNRSIYTIPTGVCMDRSVSPADENRLLNLKASLGIAASDRVLVTVGRLAKEKNIEELIDYLKKLPDYIKLVIVGDGPHRARLEEYVKQKAAENQVFFTGMVSPEQVPLYYGIGDVFVCASNSEAQGLVYFEALAGGLPVVCRKDPCLEDVVVDGKNGFQYRTFGDFYHALCFLLGDETQYTHMSAQARKSAGQYSAEAFAATVEQTYRLTIGSRLA